MSDKQKRIAEIKHAAAVAGKSAHTIVRAHRSDSLSAAIRNEEDANSFMRELRGVINLAKKK